MKLPRDMNKSLSLAGLVSEDVFELGNGASVSKGTVLWGGMTGMTWVSSRFNIGMRGVLTVVSSLSIVKTVCVAWRFCKFSHLVNARFMI